MYMGPALNVQPPATPPDVSLALTSRAKHGKRRSVWSLCRLWGGPRWPHVWHDAFKCVTWRIRVCDMTHSCVWHDSFMCVTWLIHMCDVTPSYVWHDSLTCVTWFIHMCDMTCSHVWHDSFTCVTWLIHMCDMTHSYVWHVSFICVTRLADVHHGSFLLDMPHSYVWHDSFICAMTHFHWTWLVHLAIAEGRVSSVTNKCDMTHAYVWHDSFMCAMTHVYWTWLLHTCDMTRSCVSRLISTVHDSFICVTRLIHMCHDSFLLDMTHSYVWHDSFICAMTHFYWTWLVHSAIAEGRVPALTTTRNPKWLQKRRSGELWALLLLDAYNSEVPIISTCCFQKLLWYKLNVCCIALYQVLYPLSILSV